MSLSTPTTRQPSFASVRAQSDPINPPDPVISTFLFDVDILPNITGAIRQVIPSPYCTVPEREKVRVTIRILHSSPHVWPQGISYCITLFRAGADSPLGR